MADGWVALSNERVRAVASREKAFVLTFVELIL
jgi:hypothetical protein